MCRHRTRRARPTTRRILSRDTPPKEEEGGDYHDDIGRYDLREQTVISVTTNELRRLARAARAALVMPAAFAFALFVIRDAQVALFVPFGCIALLVMVDIGGPRRPRAVAYAATTCIGAVLIALGTLASFSPWVAALVMLLVGFAVSFAGVFGGYVAAAQTALLLTFVLAVSIPAPPAAIASRLVGWLIAGVVSTLAGVLLWPRFERLTLRQQAAAACRAVGLLIQAQQSRAASPDERWRRFAMRTPPRRSAPPARPDTIARSSSSSASLSASWSLPHAPRDSSSPHSILGCWLGTGWRPRWCRP